MPWKGGSRSEIVRELSGRRTGSHGRDPRFPDDDDLAQAHRNRRCGRDRKRTGRRRSGAKVLAVGRNERGGNRRPDPKRTGTLRRGLPATACPQSEPRDRTDAGGYYNRRGVAARHGAVAGPAMARSMRCAPLAIRWNSDPDRLVRESVISAVPTHWDRRCGWSCALVNLAAAAALRMARLLTPEALLQAAQSGMAASLTELRQYGYRAEIPGAVSEAVLQASRSTHCGNSVRRYRHGLYTVGPQGGVDFILAGGELRIRPQRDRRSGWRHGHQRRHRRSDARGAIWPDGHSLSVVAPGGRDQDGAGVDGIPCRPPYDACRWR